MNMTELFADVPRVQFPAEEEVTRSNLFDGAPRVIPQTNNSDPELASLWTPDSEEGETSVFETYMVNAVNEWSDALKLGYQESLTGMINRGGREADGNLKEDKLSLMGTFFHGLGQSVDLPYYLAGFALGSGGTNPMTGAAGAMALPQGLKQVYIDRLRKGEVQDARDFAMRSGDALKETAKGWLVGATGQGVGSISSKLTAIGAKVPLEVITMTAVSSALEGQLPSAEDFSHTAMTILAMHAGTAIMKAPKRVAEKAIVEAIKKRNAMDLQSVKDRLMDHYLKTGQLPSEALLRAQKDQVFAQELLAVSKVKAFPESVKDPALLKELSKEFSTTELSEVFKKAKATADKLISEGMADPRNTDFNKIAAGQKATLKGQGAREVMELKYRKATGEKGIDPVKFKEWVEQQKTTERVATTQEVKQVGKAETLGGKAGYVIERLTNNLHPLVKYTEKLVGGKKNARLLDVIDNPAKVAQLSRGLAGKMTHFYEFGGYDITTLKTTTRGMKQILNDVNKLNKGKLNKKESQKEFTNYIVAKHARELEARKIKTGMEHIDKTFTKKLDAKYEKLLLELVDLQNAALKQLHDVGIISDLAWKNTMLRKQLGLDKFHMPFKRLIPKDGTSFELGAGMGVRNPLKARKGGTQKILDPLESIQLDIMGKLQAVENQRIAQSIVELTKAFDIGGSLIKEKVKAREITSEELIKIFESEKGSGFFSKDVGNITMFKKGKRIEFKIDKEVAELVKTIGVEHMPGYVKVLAPFASTLRAGATLLTDFAIKNIVRDSVMSYVNTKNSQWVPRFGIDIAMEMFKRSKKTDRYKDFLKAGGANSTLISIDRPSIRKQVMNDIQRTKFHNVIAKANPLKAMRDFSEHMEMATRLAEFKLTNRRMAKAGKKGYRAQAEAGFESREITLDFARTGSKTKQMNRISAFFNATVQGHSKIFRSLTKSPAAAMKVALAVVVPSIMIALNNQGDEDIKEIPKVQRDLFWVFKLTDDIIVRIPKPHEIGMAGSIVERSMAYILDEDPHAFDDMLSSFGGIMMPNVIPTALLPITEAYFNHSFFRDRKLVSVSNEKKLAEYQYTQHTSELAKGVAQMIAQVPGSHILDTGRSPIAIENYVAAWTGGLGKHTLWGIDQLLQKAGVFKPPVKPTVNWTEYPMVRSFFVRNPSLSAESISTFYSNFEEGQRIAQTISGLKRELKFDDIPSLMLQSDFNAMSGFKELMSNISKVRNYLLIIPEIDGMTKEQLGDWKREQMDILISSQIKVAKAGNQLYEQIKSYQSSNEEMRSLLLNGK